jgi:hypothetical protein
MEWLDTNPPIEVPQAEFLRLLGYPRDHEPAGRALELIEWTRAWFADHAHPWVCARSVRIDVISPETVRIDAEGFFSHRMARRFADANVRQAMLVAVSAGPEVETQAKLSWERGLPDEYFFLECFGSAVVEQLVSYAGCHLDLQANAQSLSLMRHESPGYGNWDIGEQVRLLKLTSLDRLETLESGMLRPKKSQLAVFGLTENVLSAAERFDAVSCRSCALAGCDFRRPARTEAWSST